MGESRSVDAPLQADIGVKAYDSLYRFSVSVLTAVAAVLALGDYHWPAVWFAAAILVQVAVVALGAPIRRGPDRSVSPWRKRALALSLDLSAAVFAAAAPMLWVGGGRGARMFALILLVCGAVTVLARLPHRPRQLWLRSAPFLLLLVALPLSSFLTADASDRGLLGAGVVVAALLATRLVFAGSTSISSVRRMQQALDEAQRERLRAEAASAAKSEFLDLMGHELRTPLNGVLGMAQAMASADLPAEQRKQLEVLRASGEVLLLLVNDVLEFSRVSVAEAALEQGVVEPRALSAETQQIFGPLAEAKGLALKVAWLSSAGELRAGDPRRLRQLIRAVVGVAIKSADAGEVSVLMSGDADALKFELSGVFPVDSAFATPEAWQGGSSRSSGGLVLGIARDLARRMGGDMAVTTDPSGWTTLVARAALPLQFGALPTAGEAFHACPAPVADNRLRVLAAEDNPTNQLVLKTLLEQAGLAVHIVADGEEAVAAWRSAPWDLVLMDIRMPRMDGVAATRTIRALEAAGGRPRTPILAVTADAMSHQSQQYAEAGMDGVIAKPIQFAELASVVAAMAASCVFQEPLERRAF